jgi:hypothetical protein
LQNGRPITEWRILPPRRYEDEPVDAAKKWRTKLGVSAWDLDTWVGSYEAIAAGEFERVDPALGTILRRPASDLEAYLAAHPAP